MNKLLLLLAPTFILLGSISSNAAQADGWTYITSSLDNTQYYVSTESIKKRYGMEVYSVEGSGVGSSTQHVEAWWKAVNADSSYTQVKTKFFCSLDISKNTSQVRYSAADTYIDAPSVGHYAVSTIPNTSFSKVFNFVCS